MDDERVPLRRGVTLEVRVGLVDLLRGRQVRGGEAGRQVDRLLDVEELGVVEENVHVALDPPRRLRGAEQIDVLHQCRQRGARELETVPHRHGEPGRAVDHLDPHVPGEVTRRAMLHAHPFDRGECGGENLGEALVEAIDRGAVDDPPQAAVHRSRALEAHRPLEGAVRRELRLVTNAQRRFLGRGVGDLRERLALGGADEVVLLRLQLRPDVVVVGDPRRVVHHEGAVGGLTRHHAVVELVGGHRLDPAAGHRHRAVGGDVGGAQHGDQHPRDVLADAAALLVDHVRGVEGEALPLAHRLAAVADFLSDPVEQGLGLLLVAPLRDAGFLEDPRHRRVDLVVGGELALVDSEEPATLRFPALGGGDHHLGHDVGRIGHAQLVGSGGEVVAPPRVDVLFGVVAGACVEGAAVDLRVQALVRRQVQLVALLHGGHVGLEEDDVEVLAGHRRDEAVVVVVASAAAASLGPSRRRVEQRVAEALSVHEDLDAVADLEAGELEQLHPVAPVDHVLRRGQVEDVGHRHRDPFPLAQNRHLADVDLGALRVVAPAQRGEPEATRGGQHLVEDRHARLGDSARVDVVDRLVVDEEVVEPGMIRRDPRGGEPAFGRGGRTISGSLPGAEAGREERDGEEPAEAARGDADTERRRGADHAGLPQEVRVDGGGDRRTSYPGTTPTGDRRGGAGATTPDPDGGRGRRPRPRPPVTARPPSG